MTESELRSAVNESRKEGFRILFQQYKGYVYAIVWNRICKVGSHEDAEECVSDVFTDVFRQFDQIEEDIENYYSNIRDIALYDYNIIGAEGESYHYEGGTNRTYIDRRRLYNGIIPLVVIH